MGNNASLPTIIAVVTSLAAYAGCEPEKELQNQIDSAARGLQTTVQAYANQNDPNYTLQWPAGHSNGQQAQPGYGQPTYTQQNYQQQSYPSQAYPTQSTNGYAQPAGYQTNGYSPSGTLPNNQYPQGKPVSAQAPLAKTNPGFMPNRSLETILVGSFNIQAFGPSKMNDQWVMERLAQVIRQFDVVAIQEIRSTDQQILAVLMSYVNATGSKYDYVLGPRLGRTVSKEQYAYIYDTNRIASGTNATYTLNDDIDALHREPLIGRFVARSNRTNRPWTFSLVNLHTDPDEAVQEVNSMGGIMREIRNWEYASAQEDDCILLGDLNAAPVKMGSLQNIGGVYPLISNQPTNVRETELYDNILIEPNLTSEFTGRAGVLSLKALLNLRSTEEALKLSDHNPVWAEFWVEERVTQGYSPNPYVANQPGYSQR